MSSSPLPGSRSSPIHRESPLAGSPLTHTPIDSSPPTPRTERLILSHPSARLSSSPASTPRVVDSPVTRTRSLRPEMSESMEGGVSPGVDFFDDNSSEEESEWEDDNGTRDFSEVEGLGLGIMSTPEYGGKSAGRKGTGRQEVLSALPPFNQIPDQSSGNALGNDDEEERRGRLRASSRKVNEARQMSLKRMSRGPKIIHNHSPSLGGPETSCESHVSQGSIDCNKSFPPFQSRVSGDTNGQGGLGRTRHRRNTSESLMADSIVNAHVHTMRVLESLSPSASLSLAHSHSHTIPYPQSLLQPLLASSSRHHISFSSPPVFEDDPPHHDPDRPRHLPAHYVKTPYPGWEKTKVFPRRSLRKKPGFIGEGEGDGKGRRVLGLVASDGEFDLRGRYLQNSDLGVGRSRSDVVREKRVWSSNHNYPSSAGAGAGSGVKRTGTTTGMGDPGESVVYATLQPNRSGRRQKVERIVIPSSLSLSLTTRSPERKQKQKQANHHHEEKATGGGGGADRTVDFDDKYLALRLRASYRALAGPWLLRALSARTLDRIQIGRLGVWSGDDTSCHFHCTQASHLRLLASHPHALDDENDTKTVFTESALLELYKSPEAGKARYTWVHWARRLAASNSASSSSRHTSFHHNHSSTRVKGPVSVSERAAQPDDLPPEREIEREAVTGTYSFPNEIQTQDTIMTIQFTHRFSLPRILVALALSLLLSIVATLLWIFVGVSEWPTYALEGRPARVGSGMLVGVLVLGLEGVVLAGWGWGSWVLL
ncbi:hypothetical protein BDV96DRAFT_636886 [Lophiotrema nucula]|uniref:Uncharacterized protein n=1 Tax=Lophiotrema nucula TaxID=690887 RepID=A0A6A5YN00_9PLEO|nr:hypothetical protein BDV96DRAFT_636886 [Lophiotrema nucula]